MREGSLAGVSEAIKVAAAAGKLHPSLGTGSLPGAVAGAVFEVSEAGYAYTRGTIDARELAARSCRSSMQTGLVWACGTVGQTVIPVPVVGALAGGLVGQWSATVIAEGFQAAVVAARRDALDEQRIAELEAEVREAVTAAALLAEAERDLGRQRNARVTVTVVLMLDDALVAVAEGSDDAIKRLTELARSCAGQPLFCTVEEFDLWMANPDTVLVLNPNLA